MSAGRGWPRGRGPAMRLSTRIALAVGVAVPLLVLAAGWVQIRLVARDLHEQQDAQLRARADAVQVEARRLLRISARDLPGLERASERRLFETALDVGIQVNGVQGVVAEGGPQPGPGVRLPASAAQPTTAGSWRVLSVPLDGPRPAMSGTLWVFAPDTTSREQLAAVRRRVGMVALLAAPAGFLLAWAVASAATRPLRRLQKRTSGLDPQRAGTREAAEPTRERTGITEVNDLDRTIQTVLARYDEQAARTADALATARSFAATASHELRTPLMSMRTNLDVLAAHPDLPAPEQAEVLTDLQAEHERMLGLLVMLRLLAEGDLVQPDAFGPVDLAELAESEARGVRARHPEMGLTVTGASVTVHGWEPGLRSAVGNLLSNAAVHGHAGDKPARVILAVGPGPAGHAVVTVDDAGPGIPPQQREQIFQRFRHRPGSPGSGLGLTLVAQQIALHGGTVQVLSPPSGEGTRFALTLPLDGPRGPAERRDWLSPDSHKNGS